MALGCTTCHVLIATLATLACFICSLLYSTMKCALPGPLDTLVCSNFALQGHTEVLATELEASRAQAAQADAEAAETEDAFRLLQAEVAAKPSLTGS